MQVNYSNEDVIKSQKSIFLAGPTTRSSEITAWRLEALEILKQLNYDGVVYIPEHINMRNGENYFRLREWELLAMNSAKTIVFWVPRDKENLLGLTTNVEFGYWIRLKKIIYGRPNDAAEIRYLDWLYEKEIKQKPFDSLKEMLDYAIK